MNFRVLGSLEVEDDRGLVSVGAGKQRATLAVLLLHANEVLPVDRLIDELWAEAPPTSARKALQVYVSRLRKVLGEDRIQTSGSGYLLRVAPGELDLQRFERLLQRGRDLRSSGEPALASTALREALALWHGPALADLSGEPFAQAEIPRLEALRVAGLEELMEAELALGSGPELAGELETLVARHPYRERLRGQLMLALYRAGRQADALELYQQTRRLFVEELGIEPSPALQRLEGAILRHESRLEGVSAPPGSDQPAAVTVREPRPSDLPRRGQRRALPR